jgi:P-type Ca2+ transporter type 2C
VNETASISAAERRRFAAIVFVTELQFFQRVFDTVELTGNQWLICIGAALTIVVASEIRKFLLRRREPR